MYHNHHLHETKHLKEANLLQEEKYLHLTTEPAHRPTFVLRAFTAVQVTTQPT